MTSKQFLLKFNKIDPFKLHHRPIFNKFEALLPRNNSICKIRVITAKQKLNRTSKISSEISSNFAWLLICSSYQWYVDGAGWYRNQSFTCFCCFDLQYFANGSDHYIHLLNSYLTVDNIERTWLLMSSFCASVITSTA